jgi:hypothetical protein
VRDAARLRRPRPLLRLRLRLRHSTAEGLEMEGEEQKPFEQSNCARAPLLLVRLLVWLA